MAQQKARAARISRGFGIDQLTFDEISVPQPGAGEVLVRVHAVSLNYRDYLMVAGHYNPKLQMPLILCSDGAGVIEAVGDGVTQWKVGDRVMGNFFQTWVAGAYRREYGKSALGGEIDGMLTDYRVLAEEGLVRVPEHMSFEEGATLPCAALTAWNALVPTAHLKAGDTVLLQGTGGVSIFGLQLAKAHGARTIITSSSDDKLQRAKQLGAADLVNYRNTPDWEKEVYRLTDGRGADVILEVGGAETLPRSLKAVRPGGQISMIGVLSGVSQPIAVTQILHNVAKIQGIYVGSVEMFEDMNRALAVNNIKPVVDQVYPFDQTQEALRHMEGGKHFGKIVIRL
jgi:NADPH:quinone reductase-like Zn-dependent oxidoreductase